jgi:hypothetical protein
MFWNRREIVWRGKGTEGEKNCALADQKVANGCILNRTGKLKMAIPGL